MSANCGACGSANRDGARFCRGCGKSITPGGSLPGPAGGFVASPVRPPSGMAPPPIPVVPRGTVVREPLQTPGTVLHSQRRDVPVCGWLVILRGRRKGKDFRIDKEVSVLGRDGTCDYPIEDELVSRQHVRIRMEGGKFVLFDLGSGNGTYVNGEAVQKADLQDGDVIKIGESLILFKEAKPRIPLSQADVPPPSG